MSEYLNKQEVLGWLDREIKDESWIGESAERGMRTLRTFILNGAFDIDKKEISDGYHTFGELYYHRMVLFSIICNAHKDKAWKSWKHYDGTMFDDMFIVGIETPEGHYSYHYHSEYWDAFDVKELEHAPEWDGHQPKDVTRLLSLPQFDIELKGIEEYYAMENVARQTNQEVQRLREALDWVKQQFENEWTYEPGIGEVVEEIITKFEQKEDEGDA